jgi:hypothetical protein
MRRSEPAVVDLRTLDTGHCALAFFAPRRQDSLISQTPWRPPNPLELAGSSSGPSGRRHFATRSQALRLRTHQLK